MERRLNRQQELIALQGLPASGKSTYAKNMLTQFPNEYKVVNKDSLRLMLDNSQFTSRNEEFVVGVRDFIINKALNEGWSVIVDDTNFSQVHLDRFAEMAKRKKVSFQIIEMQTPMEECIRRDALRPNPVGESIIRLMKKRDSNGKKIS